MVSTAYSHEAHIAVLMVSMSVRLTRSIDRSRTRERYKYVYAHTCAYTLLE